MNVREDHQLFYLLRTHTKKPFLILSTLDWLKARLGVCSVYEIVTQKRLRIWIWLLYHFFGAWNLFYFECILIFLLIEINLEFRCLWIGYCRSSLPEVFSGKSVLKICSIFTGEHAYWSMILIKLQSNFIEITLRHGCSPVNLLYFFRTSFPKNTSGRLRLHEV